MLALAQELSLEDEAFRALPESNGLRTAEDATPGPPAVWPVEMDCGPLQTHLNSK